MASTFLICLYALSGQMWLQKLMAWQIELERWCIICITIHSNPANTPEEEYQGRLSSKR